MTGLMLWAPKIYGNENEIADKHCPGVREYKLTDNTRVDCLTDRFATEYDYARKYYECYGQALHYSRLTARAPKCVLILTSPLDCKYYNRMILDFVLSYRAPLILIELVDEYGKDTYCPGIW